MSAGPFVNQALVGLCRRTPAYSLVVRNSFFAPLG